ncbi:hypothetical protein BV20DRAFT_1003272 [Pilatotrama ljubarskyi]|nr:hypothetical protein BV20DRAFT_1003272 [Pilatotrama ljubarskyi]
MIDVRKGKEESDGSSWKVSLLRRCQVPTSHPCSCYCLTQNTEEGHTVVNLVRHYYHKYRLEFCVITPYDAQRALLTRQLEAAGLPSDIVYNVDSFQGHEAPYVIVSAVRTTRPGFLSFQNRMNVMLSRCKAGMVLVTQRAFIDGGGKNTLLGKLVREWESAPSGAAGEPVWADAMEVASGRANLPGVPGRQPSCASGATASFGGGTPAAGSAVGRMINRGPAAPAPSAVGQSGPSGQAGGGGKPSKKGKGGGWKKGPKKTPPPA